MKTLLSTHWVIAAAIWYFVNGLLHTIAVWARHKGPYDRELLRLLMDGHLLMLSGAAAFVCWLMLLNRVHWGSVIAIIVAAFMLLYCAMIFPFLKSFGTMGMSVMLAAAAVRALTAMPALADLVQGNK